MQTTFDFQDGKGPVPARRHINPDGSLGGWVADTAVISEDTFLDPSSFVLQNAVITGKSIIRKNCTIKDYAEINNSIIGDNNKIYHHTFISHSHIGNNNYFWHSGYIFNSIIGNEFRFCGDCFLQNTILKTNDKILIGNLNNATFTITKNYFYYLKHKSELTLTEELYRQILLILQKTL